MTVECIVWQHGQTWNGYGKQRVGNKTKRAHVVVYEAAHGPVPAGLEVSHTCHNRLCVELTHLVAETHAENVGRRKTLPKADTCANGHQAYVTQRGRRVCTECNADRGRRFRAKASV